jgi:hypothetical protein
MSKSLVTYILGAALKVLEDLKTLSPTPVRGVDRDSSRLTSLAETRGLPTFTLDLPAFGKHFDKCLAEGRYTKLDGPLMKAINAKTPLPRLFSGLMLAVFTPDGVLRSDACVHTIAALRQIFNLARKLEVECNDTRKYESIREFYATEEALPPPTLRWGEEVLGTTDERLDFLSYAHVRDPGMFGGLPDRHAIPRLHLDIVQRVFDNVTIELGPLDLYRWKAKHGRGAVADGKLGKFLKYDFPCWPSRLEPIFPYADFAFANFSQWADSLDTREPVSKADPPSVLCMVPKTQKGPRLIAKEPTANQWCQQALLDYFVTRIKHSYIGRSVHFDDQTSNQERARSASVHDNFWTVDLSAASDRVTCRFVERAFRCNPHLLDALNASRTHYLSQRIDKASPPLIKLKKFSTMGSACTFPVESLIFYGLSVSSVLIAREMRATPKNIKAVSRDVLVFGDDIVIPSDSGPTLVGLLNHFSFKVNPDKTFTDGKFRESCGMECFDGVDVTPSYIPKPPRERRPESIVSQVAASNNFFLRGFWKTAAYLHQRTQRNDIPVVAVGSGAFGFQSFCGTPVRAVKYDQDLQSEYICVPLISSKVRRFETESAGRLLQYFTEAPPIDEYVDWIGGYTDRPRLYVGRGRAYLKDLGKVVLVS